MRTIRVTGKGQLKARPDITRLTMTLTGTSPDYAEALRRSSDETEQIKELMSGFGFDRSELKTLNFVVDTEYESVMENNVYQNKFVGYRFIHRLKAEFPSDNERLGRILYALAKCPVDPEFQLSYTVSDPEAAKNKLLEQAVTDAREKAEVLTKAAGVALKEIQSVDYSWDTIEFETHATNRMMLMKDMATATEGSFDMDIEPDDIVVSDTVTVTWEIS